MKALEILLGYGCNEKCSFCSQETSWRKQDGLAFETAARELYLASKDGFKSVCFTGGEPTLRKDLVKLVALARRLGFDYIRVQTNGVRLADRGYCQELIGAGATFFRISIHDHRAEVHDRLVKVPGALEKALAGAANIRAAGAGVGINYVITQENHSGLAETVDDFLGRGLGRFVIIFPLYEGDLVANEQDMRVSMQEVVPSVRRAFEVFQRRGAEFPRLLNFTPCAAPELAPHMLSWSAHSALVVDRAGRPVDLYMASHDDRSKTGVCETCILSGDCLGFKKSYLERFPEGAPHAVESAPASGPAPGAERILRSTDGLFEASTEIARALQPVPPEDGAPGPLQVERMRVTIDPSSGLLQEQREVFSEEGAHA